MYSTFSLGKLLIVCFNKIGIDNLIQIWTFFLNTNLDTTVKISFKIYK